MATNSTAVIWEYIDESMDFVKNSPERKAFWNHMRRVILALHLIDSVDAKELPKSAEAAAIIDCIYDFESQGIIENS